MAICSTVSFSGRALLHGLGKLNYAVLPCCQFCVYIHTLESIFDYIVRFKRNTDKLCVAG
jgi:hypothetical protein